MQNTQNQRILAKYELFYLDFISPIISEFRLKFYNVEVMEEFSMQIISPLNLWCLKTILLDPLIWHSTQSMALRTSGLQILLTKVIHFGFNILIKWFVKICFPTRILFSIFHLDCITFYRFDGILNFSTFPRIFSQISILFYKNLLLVISLWKTIQESNWSEMLAFIHYKYK